MSGAIAQMAANNPSQEYQVSGGPALLQPAGESSDSVPLPLEGGRRRRGHKSRHHKKTAGRRRGHTKKHTRRHRRR
jgi:hypothetical protein